MPSHSLSPALTKKALCVPEPFNIQDERNPRPASRSKYVRPAAELPAVSTFGTSPRDVCTPAATSSSPPAPDVLGVESADATSRKHFIPGKTVTTASSWAADATHVVAFNTHATEDYIASHPRVATKVREMLAGSDPSSDMVPYRALLRKNETAIAAARDAAFYDEATGSRLKASEFVYRYRSSKGERRSPAIKTLFDGRPLSTFGRCLLLESVTVPTPGPLDYVPAVQTAPPPQAQHRAVSPDGELRKDVLFSRTGLVGVRSSSRSSTPWAAIGALKRAVSSTPHPTTSSRHCESVLATRPPTSQQLHHAATPEQMWLGTPNTQVHVDRSTLSHDAPPLALQLDDPTVDALLPAEAVAAHTRRNSSTPMRSRAVSPLGVSAATTRLVSEEQTPEVACLQRGVVSNASTAVATPAVAALNRRASAGVSSVVSQTQSTSHSHAAASHAPRRASSDDDPSRTHQQPLSATQGPLPLFSAAGFCGQHSDDTPTQEQQRHQISRCSASRSAVAAIAAANAAIPPLEDCLKDPHFTGIGGTWAACKFMATQTQNVHLKRQEERRRRLLRVRDSSAADDVPQRWLPSSRTHNK